MAIQEHRAVAHRLAHKADPRTADAASGVHAPEAHDHEHGFDWLETTRIAFVAVAAAAVWFGIWEPIRGVSLIGIVSLLAGGWPIFREAVENILARRMTMELSMTIALVAGAAIGEFFHALVIAP